MDPLTHLVVGRAVVAVADREVRAPRGVGWAAILGALAPDNDSAVMFSGWDRYVRIHEFATHSVLGAMLLAGLTAILVSTVARWRDRRWPGRPPPAPFGILFGAAAAGALSHLILDIVCGGRLRPGWPLLDSRVMMPLVAMADPWFVAICVVGLLAWWPGGLPWRAVSRGIVAGAVLLLVAKGALLARALRSAPAPASLSALEANWGSLTEWVMFERTPTTVRAWTISGRGGPAVASMSHAAAADGRIVRASRSLETVRNFLSVHDFSFAVERTDPRGRVEELWTDLRYCWPTTSDDAAVVRAGESTSCGVWAGGRFDAGGRALMQLVRIGRLVQTRPAP